MRKDWEEKEEEEEEEGEEKRKWKGAYEEKSESSA